MEQTSRTDLMMDADGQVYIDSVHNSEDLERFQTEDFFYRWGDRPHMPRVHFYKAKNALRGMEVETELLKSEGIDPTWPGFEEPTSRP